MTLTINNINYEYKIIHKNIKNIYYRLKDNVLFITCPKYINDDKVIELLNKDKISRFINKSKKEYINLKDLTNIDILDEKYNIYFDNKNYIEDNNIHLTFNNYLNEFIDILTNKLKEYSNNRVKELYYLIYKDNQYPIVKYKYVKTYFGQYNKKNHQITLNSYLSLSDYNTIDYVILHELCHIKYMNHSKKFHLLLDTYMPNNKEIRRKLKRGYKEIC